MERTADRARKARWTQASRGEGRSHFQAPSCLCGGTRALAFTQGEGRWRSFPPHTPVGKGLNEHRINESRGGSRASPLGDVEEVETICSSILSLICKVPDPTKRLTSDIDTERKGKYLNMSGDVALKYLPRVRAAHDISLFLLESSAKPTLKYEAKRDQCHNLPLWLAHYLPLARLHHKNHVISKPNPGPSTTISLNKLEHQSSSSFRSLNQEKSMVSSNTQKPQETKKKPPPNNHGFESHLKSIVSIGPIAKIDLNTPSAMPGCPCMSDHPVGDPYPPAPTSAMLNRCCCCC